MRHKSENMRPQGQDHTTIPQDYYKVTIKRQYHHNSKTRSQEQDYTTRVRQDYKNKRRSQEQDKITRT